MEAFPDIAYESMYKHESGNTTIDEGYFTGTNSAPLPLPCGETLPATGKPIRIRGCDIATVESGLISKHRLYYDQLEFWGSLTCSPRSFRHRHSEQHRLPWGPAATPSDFKIASTVDLRCSKP
jgi:hypothetical protein